MQETICILYTAKPLTFLPERSILFAELAMNNHKEVLHDTRRILGDPNSLSRYKPWGRLCVLFKKVPERRHPAGVDRLCRRSDGGGIGMELADSGHGTGCRSGQVGVFPGGSRLLAGHPVFAAAGPSHPTSATRTACRPKGQKASSSAPL